MPTSQATHARALRALASITLVMLCTALPALMLVTPGGLAGRDAPPEAVEDVPSGPASRAHSTPVARGEPSPPDLHAYEKLATWVDIYDRWPWRHPVRAAERMQRRQVHTVFLQTGNYASHGAIFRPRATGRLLAAAHARNIHVVAWYVPGFKDLERDTRRVRAALRFRARGQRFDSFALDIEATQVADIARRNARATHLAKHLDRFAADAYPLGAIVPEAHARYWPNFPYRAMSERFDIFLPMAYFTYRTSGRARVFRFTSENMREIRSRTRNPKVPIHPIGGLAGKAAPDDVAGFVSAARKHDAIGASLYDFKLMQPREWRRLKDSFGR